MAHKTTFGRCSVGRWDVSVAVQWTFGAGLLVATTLDGVGSYASGAMGVMRSSCTGNAAYAKLGEIRDLAARFLV
ncbi:hypothetical protein BST26_19875, partial [Mycolicibacterium insubricum]